MRFRAPSTLTLGLLLLAWPGVAFAQEAPTNENPGPASPPRFVPPPDVPPPGARTTHLVAGAAVALGSYGLSLGASYLFSDSPGAKELRIPVAGPWMSLAQTGCPASDPDCSPVGLVLGAALKVIGGVTQIGGLAVVGEGLFLNTSTRTRARKKSARGPELHAVPMDFGPGSAGLGLVGIF